MGELTSNQVAARWIATWFGVGFTPKAPGTAGALAALPLHWLLLWAAGPVWEFVAVLALCLVGTWSAEVTRQTTADDDPQIVVVDEVAGTLIALMVAGDQIAAQIVAFVAFRVFDIVKPWPVNRLEHLPHKGLAIMADDIAAGLLAALCTGIFRWFLL